MVVIPNWMEQTGWAHMGGATERMVGYARWQSRWQLMQGGNTYGNEQACGPTKMAPLYLGPRKQLPLCQYSWTERWQIITVTPIFTNREVTIFEQPINRLPISPWRPNIGVLKKILSMGIIHQLDPTSMEVAEATYVKVSAKQKRPSEKFTFLSSLGLFATQSAHPIFCGDGGCC